MCVKILMPATCFGEPRKRLREPVEIDAIECQAGNQLRLGGNDPARRPLSSGSETP
jgi:hypothetical protein